MKKLIASVLNARPEEERRVFLLLYQGFFTGIALAAYDVASVAVFLESFSESTLAWAFVASGALGVILTTLYSILQLRIKFKQLALLYQVLIAVFSIIIFLGIPYSPVFRFLAFILALPFTYIGILIFWGTFNRLFDIKTAKRLIGGIDTGQLIASILSLFLLGFLLDRQYLVPLHLFAITFFFMLVAAVVLNIISRQYELKRKTERNEKDEAYSYAKILKHPYVRLMVLFVVVSMISATFIDFAFLNVTKIQWKTESEIGTFIAGFEASVVIFSFLFQTFVTDWIIENYGLKIALIINPLLILLLTAGAILTGIYVGGDTALFIWLFIAVAITKLFIDSLRDALDGPSFKLYFLPIPSKIRFDINTKVEGVISSFAAMIAGVIIIALDTYFPQNEEEFSLVYLAILILPILLAWFFVTQRMHANYKVTLKETLSSHREESDNSSENKSRITASDKILDLLVLEKIDSSKFEKEVKKLASSKNKSVQSFADESYSSIDPEGEIILSDDTTKSLAMEALKINSEPELYKLSSNQLYQLSNSRSDSNRILVTKLMIQNPDDENVFILNNLLRDISLDVRRNAILAARKLRKPESFPILIDILDHKVLGNDASTALVTAGNSALPYLMASFNRSDTSRKTQIKIANILCKIDTKESFARLWDLIDFPDRRVFYLIIDYFSKQTRVLTEKERQRIYQLIEDEIYKSIWNLAAESELTDSPQNHELIEALKYENDKSFERIFKLLSIIYEKDSVALVKENLEIGSKENVTYAIELLDLFISNELKLKLFPLLEDSNIKEKLTKLQEFFTRVTFTETQTLSYIINRSYLDINRWTRASALNAILHGEIKDIDKITNSVIGQMFNNDPLIHQQAALIIQKVKPELLKSVIERLPADIRKSVNYTLSRESENLELATQFEKVLHVCELEAFKDISKYRVANIVSFAQDVRLSQGRELEIEENEARLIIKLGGDLTIENGAESVLQNEETFLFNINKVSNVKINPIVDSRLLVVDWNELITEFSYIPEDLELLVINLRTFRQTEKVLS